MNRGVAVSFTVKLEVPLQVYILSIFYHIFVYSWDALGAITLNFVWMESEFDGYKLSRSMYASIFNSFPVIRTASAKNSRFHVPQATFLFPLSRLSRNMLYGWKDNSMLAKPLAALTHLFSTVSQLFEQQMQKNRFPLGTLNVV